MMPTAASMWAWAVEPATSWASRRRSKSTEAFMAWAAAAMPSPKRRLRAPLVPVMARSINVASEEPTMIERVSFATETGDTARGALACPTGGGRAPAVIVVHEFWGLNVQTEGVAERLAQEGFVALAVDLYRGQTTKDPAEAMQMMLALPGDRALADLRAAAGFLRDHPRTTGKVAILGFCMGGAYAFRAACFVRGLSASVPFYGVPKDPDWSQVDVPILAHFCRTDGVGQARARRAHPADPGRARPADGPAHLRRRSRLHERAAPRGLQPGRRPGGLGSHARLPAHPLRLTPR
jgi:carboxymethylenebutenolidase